MFATGCKIRILKTIPSSIRFLIACIFRRYDQSGGAPMSSDAGTIKLTTAQAIVRYLANQWINIDGRELRLCGGGFGIFGHGNVTCLGEALYDHRDELPLYRGQNEQSMGFAAAAYAKYHLRRRFMFCTASAGPGTANLFTSAALAHANRLPMLMLCGDTFSTRLPDPVLQQLEHFNNPSLGVNDGFQAVSRYWDRITHPAQIIQSLPAALATLLDPADCGPAFVGLPQDVQGWAHDYPVEFFERRFTGSGGNLRMLKKSGTRLPA